MVTSFLVTRGYPAMNEGVPRPFNWDTLEHWHGQGGAVWLVTQGMLVGIQDAGEA